MNFSREMTAVIKGCAIVFMILLHVFGGSGWYDVDLPMNHNEELIRFMGSLQICVGIFVFMIGYGYAFSKKKDFLYSFTHIKKLLTAFWMVLFLLAVPACDESMWGGGKELILNMFGVSESLCWVSWFVFLYIWAMIVMPFFGRLVDRRPYLYTVVLSALSYVALIVIHGLVPEFGTKPLWHTLWVCFMWTPLILIGYLCARKRLVEKINFPKSLWVAIVAILIIFAVLFAKSRFAGINILNFDILYAPIVILCILTIFSCWEMPWLRKVMMELGDKSVYMWFVHALFLSAATRGVYARFILISDNLWLIGLWTIVLSYAVSWGLMRLGSEETRK